MHGWYNFLFFLDNLIFFFFITILSYFVFCISVNSRNPYISYSTYLISCFGKIIEAVPCWKNMSANIESVTWSNLISTWVAKIYKVGSYEWGVKFILSCLVKSHSSCALNNGQPFLSRRRRDHNIIPWIEMILGQKV